jgi:hypothetical protein
MPFEDKINQKQKGLKINNNASSIPIPKASNAAAFEEKAKESFESQEAYKNRMQELVPRFRSMIEDKILPQNKSLISKDLEQEVLNKLITVASEMNEDEAQPEAIGAVSLSMLLMKMLLLQRDIINNLSFKVERLEKNVLLEKTTDANKK